MISIIVVAFYSLSACGRNRDDRENNGEHHDVTTNGGVFASHTNQTLRISAHAMHEPLLERAAEAMGVNIVIYDYRVGEEGNHYDRMLSHLAAGTGPDLFIWGWLNPFFYRFVEENHLSDMYTVIDPTVLFMNAVTPFEIEGQLLMIPTRFGFEYVGINENAPDSIIQRFASQNFATSSLLMELHNDLLSQYPHWGEYAFVFGKDGYSFLRQELHQRVNFANQEADLSGLALMLGNLRTTFIDNNRFGTELINSTDEFMETLQARYVFHVASYPPHDALFDFANSFFAHYIPLTDESGRLIQRGWAGMNVSITNNEDSALAWAFIQEFMSQEANQQHRTTDIPILRQYSTTVVEAGFRNSFNLHQVRAIAGNREIAIQSATTTLLELSEMPMTHPVDFFLPSLTSRIFDEFLQSETTSDEAIIQMESEILAWMGTEREIIPIEEEPEDNSHLPPRTLTFQGSRPQILVAQQAAEAMNLSWRRRGEPYRFELVIVNGFNNNDWRSGPDRYIQLATQLMAGMGPDIFVVEPSHFYVHALARSGLLMDFNSLFDNSSHTRREDLFTRPLEAFEMYGGLYTLPLNLSFNYVTINANLPQSIVDMYVQMEVMTLTAMMEIYIALVTNYADEFGHMLFGQSNTLGHIMYVVSHVMSKYIDFDARSSDLMNPGFISFLDDFSYISQRLGQSSMFIDNFGSFSRELMFVRRWDRSLLFFIADGVGNFTNLSGMYFTHVDPIFTHPRLLTDNNGRILLDVPYGTTAFGPAAWPLVSIPATGEYELAWEFIQYLIRAFMIPEGRARGTWGELYGYHQLGSPIRRDLFEYHTRRSIDMYLDTESRYRNYVGLTDPVEREQQTMLAIQRMAEYNEMPMAIIHPMLPRSIFGTEREHLLAFRDGLISSLEFAQIMQNTVSLWLLE